MKEIILDISPNIHLNDSNIIRDLISRALTIKKLCDRKEIVVAIKTQTFLNAGQNLPITRDGLRFFTFLGAANMLNPTTSVFDSPSILTFKDVCKEIDYKPTFIKIANNDKYRKLRDELFEVFSETPIYESRGNLHKTAFSEGIFLCVSEYPASVKSYLDLLVWHASIDLGNNINISDHARGLNLIKYLLKNNFKVNKWEKHIKLVESTGPDAGEFAITFKELEEFINEYL